MLPRKEWSKEAEKQIHKPMYKHTSTQHEKRIPQQDRGHTSQEEGDTSKGN